MSVKACIDRATCPGEQLLLNKLYKDYKELIRKKKKHISINKTLEAVEFSRKHDLKHFKMISPL